MEETNVFIRSENKHERVIIEAAPSQASLNALRKKWQKILDASAELLDVPAALIMRLTPTSMQVFTRSRNQENPYQEGAEDHLGHGLYCEEVIGKNKPLMVENALKDDVWANNPDVEVGMISYYGLPIKWPNETMFGTICVLDRKTLNIDQKHQAILHLFKDAIETDLANLHLMASLEKVARTDALTNLLNRRGVFERLEAAVRRAKKAQASFAVAVCDLNDFKGINDRYGHVEGDAVLKRFASLLTRKRPKDAFIGRIGGDEFVIAMRDKTMLCTFLDTVEAAAQRDESLKKYPLSFYAGVATLKEAADHDGDLYRAADFDLMKKKRAKHSS